MCPSCVACLTSFALTTANTFTSRSLALFLPWQHWNISNLQAVDRLGERNWRYVAQSVGTRTHIQCQQRWKKALRYNENTYQRTLFDTREKSSTLSTLIEWRQFGSGRSIWLTFAATNWPRFDDIPDDWSISPDMKRSHVLLAVSVCCLT